MFIKLGKKDEVLNTELLTPLYITGKPTTFPTLGEDEFVICSYNQGLGEFLLICENLVDMQQLYEKFEEGWIDSISWYYATAYFI